MINIEHDNQSKAYMAGQDVTGRVRIKVNKDEDSVKGVVLCFEGNAEARWPANAESKLYHMNEDSYFKVNIQLLTPRSHQRGKDESILRTGDHILPFKFQLPILIPASYEGRYGWIRYMVTAKVSLERKQEKEYCSSYFTVVDMSDLNDCSNVEIYYLEHCEYVVPRGLSLCCCCVEDEILNVKFSVPRTGYVPGEIIEVSTKVDNTTNILYSTVLRLTESTTYKSKNEELFTHDRTILQEQPNYSENSERIVVPALAPSVRNHCDFMVVEYNLDLYLTVGKRPLKRVGRIPIEIGNFPLISTLHTFYKHPHQDRVSVSEETMKADFAQTMIVPTAPLLNGRRDERQPLAYYEDGVLSAKADRRIYPTYSQTLDQSRLFQFKPKYQTFRLKKQKEPVSGTMV